MASESMVSRMSLPESCKDNKVPLLSLGGNKTNRQPVKQEIILQGLGAYRLIGLEGGLELHVVPVSQDVAEGRLVSTKLSFPCLVDTTRTFIDFCIRRKEGSSPLISFPSSTLQNGCVQFLVMSQKSLIPLLLLSDRLQ